MTARRVVVVDYGTGNVGSLLGLLDHCGVDGLVSRQTNEILSAQIIVLPGVGSAKSAMAGISKAGLGGPLLEAVQAGTLVVGVCLGAQLMLDHSAEGDTTCLGLVRGGSTRLPGPPKFNIGWDSLIFKDSKHFSSPEDAAALKQGAKFFFNHGYEMHVTEPGTEIATSENYDTLAMFRQRNMVGIQFHPERSHSAGVQVFKKIIEGVAFS